MISIMEKPEYKSMIGACLKQYGGSYLCSTQLKNQSGRFTGEPFHFFYQEEKHPYGSNYYAVGLDAGRVVITDGISIEDTPIDGFVLDDIFYYSSHHYDYVTTHKSGYFIDGGRDYTRASYDCSQGYVLTIKDGKLNFKQG